jgi:hypothetical protein
LNPVVEAAWIAAIPSGLAIISTATVSIVSSRNAKKATIATIDAGHNARLWEKRASAYEDAVKEVQARRIRREALTSRGDIGSVGSKPIEETRKAEEPEIIKIRAALRPYASAEAWTAYQAADEANSAFWVSLTRLVSAHFGAEHRAQLREQGVPDDGLPPDPGYQQVLDAMYKARTAASDADEALFRVINRELAWRAPTAAAPSAQPAVAGS